MSAPAVNLASSPFASDGLFRSALEASPDCVKVLDLAGTIQFVNRNGVAIMGARSPAELLGRSWPGLWDEPQATTATDALNAAVRSEVQRFQAPGRVFSGEVRHFDNVLSPLRDDGGAARVADADAFARTTRGEQPSARRAIHAAIAHDLVVGPSEGHVFGRTHNDHAAETLLLHASARSTVVADQFSYSAFKVGEVREKSRIGRARVGSLLHDRDRRPGMSGTVRQWLGAILQSPGSEGAEQHRPDGEILSGQRIADDEPLPGRAQSFGGISPHVEQVRIANVSDH